MQVGIRDLSSLKMNFKEGEKIKISPVGEVVGLDGRDFLIQAQELLSALEKHALDIPLDENHSFGAAMGWFAKDSFEAREDGIYALLELNQAGLELVENKKYRYLSPVYNMKNGRVIGLDSVGLVNRPNLLNNAINAKNNQEKEDSDMQIEELQKELFALKEEVANLKKALEEQKDKEEDKKEEANTQGGEKEKNEAPKQENAQNAQTELSAKLDAVLKVFGKLALEEQKNTQGLSEEEARIARMLGLSEAEYKGGK